MLCAFSLKSGSDGATLKLLFISQLFDPENSIKGLDFFSKLVELGYQVDVVTTFPSYPGGRLYSGYQQRLIRIDQMRGVRVIRLPTYINHGKSSMKRMLSYLSFGLVACLYLMFGRRKYDVVYGYYPPVVAGLLSLIYCSSRRIPYIVDVQDLWPDALVATGSIRKDGILDKGVSRICNLIYKKSAKVVVLSEGYRNALVSRGVDSSKVVTIFNWCDQGRHENEASDLNECNFDQDKFNILYAGNFGPAQALDYVLEAARLLRNENCRHIKVYLIGTGVEESRLKAIADRYQLHNVEFLPRVAPEKIAAYFSKSDALLVHLKNSPVFDITIPQKTQAYLYAARPIIMAVHGEAADIVVRAKAGIVAEPCNAEALASAFLRMSEMSADERDQMSIDGHNYYMTNMSIENGVEAIDSLLSSVVQ